MNWLFSQIPQMSTIDLVVHIVAILGAVLLMYGVFLEAERRQDFVFLLAGACLMVYVVWLHNTILIIAFAGFTAASLFELVEILVGIHKHGPAMAEKFEYKKK
jgi:lipid-A-disaccharide synthase-like uncharacterized protein